MSKTQRLQKCHQHIFCKHSVKIFQEGHNATYDDFSILTTESNEFQLHLKESLLIKRDKPELNRNCYTHPLELFD